MNHPVGVLREFCRESETFNTIAQYAYLYLYRPPSYWTRHAGALETIRYSSASPVRVAFLCDEMTWLDFSGYCDAIFLRPDIWRKQLTDFRPDLFFCESAWSGIPPFEGCWRGRVYKNRFVRFENRRELLGILDYCRSENILTVFWNKEDPAFFAHERYGFTDTALRFDRILTISEECVPRYKSLGCDNVDVLPFGVNTDMFHPRAETPIPGTAIFAGSWFGDQPQRCKDLSAILDYAISRNWRLDIYDRHSDSPEPRFRFPAKYRPYLHNAVPFKQLPDLASRYEWALNVNTVTNSRTAYSRRIPQMLACGAKVLSNSSRGAERIPGSRNIFLDGVGNALEIVCDFEILQSFCSAQRLFSDFLKSSLSQMAPTEKEGKIRLS